MVNDVRSLEAERGWGGGGYGLVLRRCFEVGWLSSGRERVDVRRRCGPLEACCGCARQRLRSAASWLLLSVLPGGGAGAAGGELPTCVPNGTTSSCQRQGSHTMTTAVVAGVRRCSVLHVSRWCPVPCAQPEGVAAATAMRLLRQPARRCPS